MDVQIVDGDSNISPRNIMQSHELKEILDYAERWTEVSNNLKKNQRVKDLCNSINTTIDLMSSELPK